MNPTNLISPELQQLINNEISGYNYRERRHEDWTEIYSLYRDKVQVNRLLQRQSVNVPLMKQTIKTLLKDIDDMPVIEFKNLDNNDQAEIFQNEYWKYTIGEHCNKMEIKDIVDKKQVLLYGRSVDQMQIADGKVFMGIVDPMDILIDRYVDPTNIDSAGFLIHNNIFKRLSELEQNTEYDQDEVKRLKAWYQTQEGVVKLSENTQQLRDKNKKLEIMGVSDVENPVLGETYVQLAMHFVYDMKEGDEEEQLYLKVVADNYAILLNKPLEKVIGKTQDNYWRNHLPYNTWAEDIDMQDFWVDGVGDVVRTPNKVLNAWLSQLVEHRTLRSFGMHYYDSTKDGFMPQSFVPQAWGWYGVPGNPDELIKKVDIPDLTESLDEIQYVTGFIEKATGATATQQGAQTERSITLGEVQLALGEAKERVKGMSKFYTQVWKERAYKFMKLIEAGQDKLDVVQIEKQGRNSNKMYKRDIAPKDYITSSGYSVKIWSQDEKDSQDSKKLEKLSVVYQNMPGNPKLKDIYQRKLLEFADLMPNEVNEVMETQKMVDQQMLMAAQNPMMQGAPEAGTMGGMPQSVQPDALPVA